MKMLAPKMPPPPLYVKKICPIQSGNVDNLTWENDLSINFVSMCETEQFFKGYQAKIEETPSAAHKNSINFDLDGYTMWMLENLQYLHVQIVEEICRNSYLRTLNKEGSFLFLLLLPFLCEKQCSREIPKLNRRNCNNTAI